MDLEIIAELHPQHSGDRGIMREMIRTAKVNGADVVKVQLYDAELLLGSTQWDYLELTQADTAQLKTWCDQEDIEFMASVFDFARLRWCEELNVRRYKIASRTVVGDAALCKGILDTGKATIVSLGAWREPHKPFGDTPQIHYLYCKSLYPAMLEDLVELPADFGAAGLAGYSDHTLGLDVCFLAIARGARVIEKHFTLDKTRGQATEKAHICSMTPDELNLLRRSGGGLYRAQRVIRNAHGN